MKETMEHCDDKPCTIVITWVREHCDESPWSIVIKSDKEPCDDMGRELCDDRGHGAL